MKRIFLFVFALVIGLGIFQSRASAQEGEVSDAPEVIRSFTVTATVAPPRHLKVTELIDYDFGTGERHGIYRDIPISYDRNGTRYSLRLAVGSVLMDGKPIRNDVSASNGSLRIKIGDPATYVTGRHTYQITYDTDRAINFFEDENGRIQQGELYWNITGNEWNVPIEKVTFRLMTSSGDASVERVACFTGGAGSKASDCTAKTDGQAVDVVATRAFSENEGLTTAVRFAPGFLVPPTAQEKAVQMLRDNSILAVPVLVLVVMLFVWRMKGRDPEQGTIIPEYEPPKRLRPVEAAAFLADGELSPAGLTATLLDLARRGYITIRYGEEKQLFGTKQTFTFVKKKRADDGLTEDERFLFLSLFEDPVNVGAELTPGINMLLDGPAMKNKYSRAIIRRMIVRSGKGSGVLEDTAPLGAEQRADKLAETFFPYAGVLSSTEVWEVLQGKHVFSDRPKKVRSMYVTFGVIVGMVILWGGIMFFAPLLVLVSAASSALIVMAVGWFMPRRTDAGAELLRRVKGFRWFLSVTEKERLAFSDAPERTPEQFHAFLPYAVALGVEEKWAAQFADMKISAPDWMEGGGIDHFTATSFVSHLSSVRSSTASAFTTTSAGSGSSGFSGGGSSGGGFGGGGGGSW